MRVLIFILFIVYSKILASQCSSNVIMIGFPNNTAIIGQDSVEFVAIASVDIYFNNGSSHLNLFIDNILQNGAFGLAGTGQIVKTIPHTAGVETIYTNEPCAIGFSVSINIINPVLPVFWMSKLTAKRNKNYTIINWSVATQINNEKYIIEHSNPESFHDGRTFSPIGEISGDGTNNQTKL
jgi:hypothetical protein